jgi:hypothetical protein
MSPKMPVSTQVACKSPILALRRVRGISDCYEMVKIHQNEPKTTSVPKPNEIKIVRIVLGVKKGNMTGSNSKVIPTYIESLYAPSEFNNGFFSTNSIGEDTRYLTTSFPVASS